MHDDELVIAPTSTRPRWRRVLATSVAALAVLGLFLAVGAVGVVISELRPHQLAIRLREVGQSTAITATTSTPSRIQFVVAGRTITAHVPLGDTTPDPAVGDLVVYDPMDPTLALLTSTLDYYADDSVDGGLGFAVLCLSPALLTLLTWLIARRPPWWKHVDPRWVPFG